MADDLNQNNDSVDSDLEDTTDSETIASNSEDTTDPETIVETILSDVKRMLGIQPEVDEFNIDITSHINGAFFVLNQLGIGPIDPFTIDSTTEWSSFETSIPKSIVLDYLYLKTKMVFDPPAASNIVEAYKDRISELEFRMNVMIDNAGGVVSG